MPSPCARQLFLPLCLIGALIILVRTEEKAAEDS
jgi:hypothetical protein